MNTVFALTVALLPAILLWIYTWKKDPQKEPVGKLLKAVLWGVIICIPVSFVEVGIHQILFRGENPTNLIESTAQAFFLAAIPEESAKLLALWMILRKNPYFNEHFDGIIYAVCVGLGFAAFENVFYVLDSEEEWLAVGIIRSLLAVPGHYAFAVLMGFYYSVYHFVNHTRKMAACILLVPVAAHGIYDALCFSGMVSTAIGGFSFLVLILFCVKMHKVAKAKIMSQIERDEEEPI
ncbi:MAG: PrsW family intramembrane metalloprotease [Prevotella sp.]|jgi:RsiW-degrading membrane proteinase PrsW (M82 family)|nr:PrsW family intramembrane metalloprotease [Prevotella sp.]